MALPVAITQAAKRLIGKWKARLNGKMSDDGGEACDVRFRWRKKDVTFGEYDSWTGETGENKARALATDGTYLYIGLDTSPAQIKKVNPSTMAVVDSWTGGTNENSVFSLDWDGSYLYAALNTDSSTEASCVVKLDVSDMSEVAEWVHPTSGRRARSVHCFGSYIYVGDNTSTNSKVYKLNPANLSLAATWTSETGLSTVYSLEDDGTYLYAGGQVSQPGQVAKIDVSDMSTVATWTGAEVDEVPIENKVDCLVWDGSYLYAGLDATLIGQEAQVIKIDVSDMTTNDTWTDTDGEYAFSITYKSPYLYVGIETVEPGVVRLNPTNMTEVDRWEPPQSALNCIAVLGEYIYFGQTVDPAKVYKLAGWIETAWDETGYSTDATFYHDLTGLDHSTEYEFQVQARNTDGESDWSASETFKTLLIISPFPCFRR